MFDNYFISLVFLYLAQRFGIFVLIRKNIIGFKSHRLQAFILNFSSRQLA